jgi:hypothetical protein
MAQYIIKPEHRAPGGAREGAGRPPDWLKTKCRKLVVQKKLIEFLADVATGDYLFAHHDMFGKEYKAPASPKDRMRAVEMLVDRGYGRPKEHIDLNVNLELADEMKKADERYKLLYAGNGHS